MHHFDWVTFLCGGSSWMVASYAAQTFPMPDNKYAKWLLGLIQLILANKTQGLQNFTAAKQQSQDEAK